MTRDVAKKLLSAIEHYANGGTLWYLSHNNEWLKYKETGIQPTFNTYDKTAFIIEDKFFEERKAYALGQEIEVKHVGAKKYKRDLAPFWCIKNEYRIKPKEPVYEWQYLYVMNVDTYGFTKHLTDDEVTKLGNIVGKKFEPSKRLVKK